MRIPPCVSSFFLLLFCFHITTRPYSFLSQTGSLHHDWLVLHLSKSEASVNMTSCSLFLTHILPRIFFSSIFFLSSSPHLVILNICIMCQQRLKRAPNGSFLIHKSSNVGCGELSFVSGGNIQSRRIYHNYHGFITSCHCASSVSFLFH